MASYKNIFVYFLWASISSSIFAIWIYGEYEFLYEMRHTFGQTHLDEIYCWYLAVPSYVLFLTFSITIGIFICISQLKDIYVIGFRTVTVFICCIQFTVYLWYNVEIILDIQITKPVCYPTNHTLLDSFLPLNDTASVISCILPKELNNGHYISDNILEFDDLMNLTLYETPLEQSYNESSNETREEIDVIKDPAFVVTNTTDLVTKIRDISENKYVYRVFMGLITGHVLLILLLVMEQLWIVCRTSKPSKERFHVMVSEQFISVVQGLDNYDILCRHLLTHIAVFSDKRMACYIILAGFTVVMFLSHLISRLTSAGFYHSVASRIGHGSGVIALVVAGVLIAMRGYIIIVPVDTISSYLSMSDVVFAIVELYIIYSLIMLKVVTAKLPPGYNQIQPKVAKYRQT